MADSTEETVIGRWARRKSAAATTDTVVNTHIDEELAGRQMPAVSCTDLSSEVADTGPSTAVDNSALTTAVASSGQEPSPVEEDETLEPLLTDNDMPDVDTLTSSSNVSCFFNRGVSEKLRQAALKKLLHMPAFNIRDGLNDYDEDYSLFEPLGDIITSDMRYHKERLEALARKDTEEQVDAIVAEETAVTETGSTVEGDADNDSTAVEADPAVADGQSDEQAEQHVTDTSNNTQTDESHSKNLLHPISPGERV